MEFLKKLYATISSLTNPVLLIGDWNTPDLDSEKHRFVSKMKISGTTMEVTKPNSATFKRSGNTLDYSVHHGIAIDQMITEDIVTADHKMILVGIIHQISKKTKIGLFLQKISQES